MAAQSQGAALQLAFGLQFEDLYRPAGLRQLHALFGDWLHEHDAASAALAAQEIDPSQIRLNDKALAELLIAIGKQVHGFVVHLFAIGAADSQALAAHASLDALFRVKWKFVKRQALLDADEEALKIFDAPNARQKIEHWLGQPFDELAFANAILKWQEAGDETRLALARQYCAWAVLSPAGQRVHGHEVLFRHPQGQDPAHLMHHAQSHDDTGVTIHSISVDHIRRRHGFKLTDPGASLAHALDQTHYCILCHAQGKDSCSKGMIDKASGGFKSNALGTKLAGCPLEQRISEFHSLKRLGLSIGALAMITLDNPMLAGTGHRICNDCMKGCIYQKQTPVDIPQAETRTLKDVLALPWGFEIYGLLTRWNPLRLHAPVPLEPTGHKVLVAGMGPAGFTLAHHLLNAGMTVVGIDGLKIEPLASELNGVAKDGTRQAFVPIFDSSELREELDERAQAGFGGVAEYGITVRWDKNFLKIIRLLLERREHFQLMGGVRLGGTLTVDQAFAMGFDHVALALGAGKPTMLDVPGGLARGVRAASDFLMALQLSATARPEGIANLQVRLPVVVIGGGLTAIDTATEALAFYPLQVERYLQRHEVLVAQIGETQTLAKLSSQELEVAQEFLAHARALRAERQLAQLEHRVSRELELIQSWGGVRIAYRKRLIDSPAYTLNHEEVEKALEEGITIGEELTPLEIHTESNSVCAITLKTKAGASVQWPCHTVLVAAGTTPNTVLAREFPESFAVDGKYFQAIDLDGRPVSPERNVKTAHPQVMIQRRDDGRMVSFFGDLHPSYAGNVVKAMASAKRGAPQVLEATLRQSPASALTGEAFFAQLANKLHARVHAVYRLTPTIVEVVVHAPLAAENFAPGQFYRLQNFDALAHDVDKPLPTRHAMEGLALTGAWVDRARGLVSTIVLEMGGSSDLCIDLKPGEPIVLMGPTGTPTEIVQGQTVGLVGGGLGNAVLFSIGAALRAAGCKVLYFAGYKKLIDRYKIDEIEAAADTVVWCSDEAPGFEPRRPQDARFVGNIIDAIAWWHGQQQGLRTEAVDRWIAIGSDRMMAAFAAARHGVLKPMLKSGHVGLGSINSPMQCMLKEVCGQCLQRHVDPATGQSRYVFSCFEQDQNLDQVDFANLHQRLTQNTVLEKQTSHWLALSRASA